MHIQNYEFLAGLGLSTSSDCIQAAACGALFTLQMNHSLFSSNHSLQITRLSPLTAGLRALRSTTPY